MSGILFVWNLIKLFAEIAWAMLNYAFSHIIEIADIYSNLSKIADLNSWLISLYLGVPLTFIITAAIILIKKIKGA